MWDLACNDGVIINLKGDRHGQGRAKRKSGSQEAQENEDQNYSCGAEPKGCGMAAGFGVRQEVETQPSTWSDVLDWPVRAHAQKTRRSRLRDRAVLIADCVVGAAFLMDTTRKGSDESTLAVLALCACAPGVLAAGLECRTIESTSGRLAW
jgi:hypothetical protein